jgi:hypothetical protein
LWEIVGKSSRHHLGGTPPQREGASLLNSKTFVQILEAKSTPSGLRSGASGTLTLSKRKISYRNRDIDGDIEISRPINYSLEMDIVYSFGLSFGSHLFLQ